MPLINTRDKPSPCLRFRPGDARKPRLSTLKGGSAPEGIEKSRRASESFNFQLDFTGDELQGCLREFEVRLIDLARATEPINR